MKWTVEEVARRLGAEGGSGTQVTGFQIDSRMVGPGELFFALKGQRVDGHRFLGEVKRRGGVAAVVQEEGEGLELIRVADVEAALRELAAQVALERRAKVVGVTGSVGKTTTKEWIATLLEARFRVGRNVASYNSQLTFPLTILNRHEEEEVWVLEMGMNCPGEISRLVSIAAPDIGVITRVAMGHAAQFPDGVEGIAWAKAEIFASEQTELAVVDHAFLRFEAARSIRCPKLTFSTEAREADVFLSEEGWIDERGVRVAKLDVPFRESHLRHDLLAAVTVARQLGLSWEEIERQLPKLKLQKQRFQRFERGGVVWIDDSYNANPASMEAALRNLPLPQEGGKRIACLGAMRELGPFSEAEHAEMGRVARGSVDMMLTLGEETEPMCAAFAESGKPVERCADHESLRKRLEEWMRPGDVVLVKGSRSLMMERVVYDSIPR